MLITILSVLVRILMILKLKDWSPLSDILRKIMIHLNCCKMLQTVKIMIFGVVIILILAAILNTAIILIAMNIRRTDVIIDGRG